MDEWRQRRSAYYDDVANASLNGLVPAAMLLDRVSSLLSETGLPENEMPSRNLRAGVRVKKRQSGIGPYPEFVRILREWVRELADQGDRIGERVRRNVLLALCKVLWFSRLHGMPGLRAWIARRVSVSHAWRVWAARRKARRLYRESKRRSIAMSGRG